VAKQKKFLCHLSWSVHRNLAREGFIEPTCYGAQPRLLGMDTKNTLSFVMVYSALFNNEFKALN
jgi:hypothetical protein